LAAFKIDGP